MEQYVEVFTFDKRTSKQLNRNIINWNDGSDRVWLKNHTHHCMLNQKNVTLSPVTSTQP
jgi:hypothetical protein